MIYIFWTCASEQEAQKIVKQLVEKKWIACANILPTVQSFFWWDGAVQQESEVKVIMKTLEAHFQKVEHFIEKEGSYDVPEISMIPIKQVHSPYLKWLKEIVNNSN